MKTSGGRRGSLPVRICLAGALVTAFPALISAAFAAGPDCGEIRGRTVRWIVPYSPGGGYDVYSRLLEPAVEKQLGAEVVVKNVTGAGGIAGARTIMEAEADGLTLGLVNGGALLLGAFVGETGAPDPLKDFTLLGRVDSPLRVLVTSSAGPFGSLDELLDEAEKRPLLALSTEAGGLSFISSVIAARLLLVPTEFIAGYPGSREGSLAIMRGEADFLSGNYESMRDRIVSGELRPLLQYTYGESSAYDELAGIPFLGGTEGMAARRAAVKGRDAGEAVANAGGLISLVSTGRLVVAPAGLPEKTGRCLAGAIYSAMTDPDFERAAAAARRRLNVASAEETRSSLRDARERFDVFAPMIREALGKIRR